MLKRFEIRLEYCDVAKLCARIGFAVADCPDVGMSEYSGRDEFVTHTAQLVAKQMIDKLHRLAERNRRELNSRGDIAERINRRHTCLVVVIDLDCALFVLLNPKRLNANSCDFWHTTSRIQNSVDQDFRSVQQSHRQPVVGSDNAAHISVHTQSNAGLFHLRSDEMPNVFVKTAQHLLPAIKLRYLRAETVEN